jgi:hypothetical protein
MDHVQKEVVQALPEGGTNIEERSTHYEGGSFANASTMVSGSPSELANSYRLEEDSAHNDSNDDLYESVPEAVDSSSVKSCSSDEDSDGDEEDADILGLEDIPMPRLSSSTVPIVLEVAPRNVRFASDDPLFNGVCLYNSSMTTSQTQVYSSRTTQRASPETPLSHYWLFPSTFKHLINLQQQRVNE